MTGGWMHGVSRLSPVPLLVHDLGFFGRCQVVDFPLEPFGQFLDFVLGLVPVVLGEQLLLLSLLSVLVAVAADVTNRDPGFLGQFLDS